MQPKRRGIFAVFITCALSLCFALSPPAWAQVAILVQDIDASLWVPPSPDSAGIVHIDHTNTLLISDSEVNETPLFTGDNLFEIDPVLGLLGTLTTIGFSDEPTGVAYNPDPVNQHLFFSDDTGPTKRVYELNPGPDGFYDTPDDIVTSFSTSAFGSNDPEGITYNTAQGVLHIVDGVNEEVYTVDPGVNGIFDGVPSEGGDDVVTSFDTTVLGVTDPEGIAYDSDFGHLYIAGKPNTLVVHVSTTGVLVRTIDVSAANANKLSGLAYAPSSVVMGEMNLWIADRGVDNNSGAGADPNENDGKVYELSLPFFSGNAPATVTITAPANGSSFIEGDSITFTGTAIDPEDGDLMASLSWTSNLEGPMPIGTGGSFSTSTLSLGTHTITASVTDSGGLPSSDAITVTVNPEGTITTEVRVAASTDDAEERNSGVMDLASTDLDLGKPSVGLRFVSVTIPPGATISNAHVQFQADEANSTATSLTIEGEASDDAPTFTSATNNITSRPTTAAFVSWDPAAWAVGEAGLNQQTQDIAAIIQEIVNRPGWSSGNAIVIIITGSGDRPAESFDGPQQAGAPLLHVDYLPPLVAPTIATIVPNTGPAAGGQTGVVITGTNLDGATSVTFDGLTATITGNDSTTITVTTPAHAAGAVDVIANVSAGSVTATGGYTYSGGGVLTLEVQVAAGTDDAEERVTGSMRLGSTDLELVFDAGGNQTVGMRFNGVTIPPGASISNTYIQFQADEQHSGATNLTIEGEDVDNALTFTTATNNITSRPRTTAAAVWASVPPWTTTGEAGPDQQTPDIASVIQEIVNRPGWSSGNSLVLIITGTGERVAESFNGVSSAAPLLHVEYSTSGNQFPAVTISAPADGSTFNEGNSITFSGTASDFEDGDLTASLAWESDLDGPIGNGGSFSRSDLSVGVHTVTAMVTDTVGQTAFDTATITVFADTAVLVGAGDISTCSNDHDEETAQLLETIAGTVFTLGDNAYEDGTDQQFNDCYDPTWGRHKARTFPAVGNHEYNTPGASGHFSYFGVAAGDPTEGYYSYDLGDWHIVVLNTECNEIGGCGSTSPQGQWLQADLAANPSECTLAYTHHPRFSSGSTGNSPFMVDFWQILYDAGADVVLGAHDHIYERFAPQDPSGVVDPVSGIRQFVVGTGGRSVGPPGNPQPNSEANGGDFGVLKLTLHPTSYDWEFIPIAGQTFSDSGSTSCNPL